MPMDAADPDLPDSAVEHISQMLTLAKRKHQEAIAMLGTPDPSAVPRLREVLRLLEEVELLAVQMAIAQLEQMKARSAWATPWPWITIMALALIIAQAFR